MPDPVAPQTESPAAPPLNEDAYCPSCGYNVRGLPGDPIRCPECGGGCDRAELRWPKRPRVTTRQERARRSLQRCADLCAMATLPGLIGAAVLLDGGYVARQLALPVTITSGIVWLLGFTLFAWRCGGLPKWGRALAVYHLAAAPAMAVELVLVLVAWGFVSGMCGLGLPRMFDTFHALIPVSAVGTTLVGWATVTVLCLPGVGFAWLAVRLNPLGWFKRLGADRLYALADQLAERQPKPDAQAVPPSASTSDTPPADSA